MLNALLKVDNASQLFDCKYSELFELMLKVVWAIEEVIVIMWIIDVNPLITKTSNSMKFHAQSTRYW